MKQRWISIIAMLGMFCPVLGQTNNLWSNLNEIYNKSVPTPNAAALGKFSEIPVSHYTGVPSIEVPIYFLKEGKINMPISLKYHSSGIKVDEIASDVGLGWALQAGGTITRIVMGIPDERGFLAQDYSLYDLDEDYNSGSNINMTDSIFLKIGAGKRDNSSDIYHYNLGNMSGKFVFNQKLNRFHSLDDPMLVINYQKIGDDFEFEIIDSEGLVYQFGTKEYNPTDINIESFNQFVSSWKLDRIYDPNTIHEIHFTYLDFLNARMDLQVSRTHLFGINGTEYTDEYYNGKTVTQADLKKLSMIQAGPLKIDFIYQTPRYDMFNDFGLDEIQVSGYGQTILNASLFQSYFNVNEIPTPNTVQYSTFKRLRLDSLLLSDLPKDNLEGNLDPAHPVSAYKFIYNNSMAVHGSKSQDYWGYFNGRQNSHLFDGATYSNMTFSGADRNVDPYSSDMGILRQIIYPTGAVTNFVFESNRGKLVNSNRNLPNEYLGGLRIKEITTLEVDGDTLGHRYFKYLLLDHLPASSGRGQLYQSFNQRIYQWSRMLASGPSEGTFYSKKNLMRRYSKSMYPLLNDHGGGIGYKEVQEYNRDPGIGFVNYRFTSLDQFPDVYNELNSRNNIPESWEAHRGKLWEKSWYDHLGVLKKREINIFDHEFVNRNATAHQDPGYFCYLVDIVADYGEERLVESLYNDPEYSVGAYSKLTRHEFHPSFVPLKEKKEIRYGINGSDTVTTVYQYDGKYWLNTEQTTVLSKGDTLVNKSLYPWNFPLPASGQLDNRLSGIKNLLAKNILSRPVATLEEIRKNQQVKTLSAVFYGHDRFRPVLDTVFTFNIDPTFPRALASNGLSIMGNHLVLDPDFRVEYILSSYDTAGNVVESRMRNGHLRSMVYVNGYRDPVIVADNLGYEDLLESLGGKSVVDELQYVYSESQEDIPGLVRKVQRERPGAMVVGYVHNAFGVETETDLKGLQRDYRYDNIGRLSREVDHDGKILRSFLYKYHRDQDNLLGNSKVYYNTERSANFTKNNCGPNLVGSIVKFVVRAREYYSTVSQHDADSKAILQLNQNGQAYANIHGSCSPVQPLIYWNQQRSQIFSKKACEEDDNIRGETLAYVIKANSFSSVISVQHANQRADSVILAKGQDFVDSVGVCLTRANVNGILAQDNVLVGIEYYGSNNQLVHTSSIEQDTNGYYLWVRPGQYSKVRFLFDNLDQVNIPNSITLQIMSPDNSELGMGTVNKQPSPTNLEFSDIEILTFDYGLYQIFLTF